MAFDCYLIRDHFFSDFGTATEFNIFPSLLLTSAASSSFYIWISLEIELRKKHSLCPHVQLFYRMFQGTGISRSLFFTAKQM